ncbi:hypothetical protein COX85_01090 [Candidatus Micrarchaeota archaeon CG_4_10_14_0_2_um_filter_55_9]|nr:MAG: hypothetical protein AUJ15_01560 [Candidatus Micrarchaeota archaeon CG1_02_55_41]PIZ91947.1 MAG: hypothetical protein COX85_01090 [Candidatus Micrarchaeota archaeon CG_4_10_14_0_2_um_filter_55_9]
MFEFDFSDELKTKIALLLKRNKKRVEIINKKVREIISSDEAAIGRYKNLRRELKHLKRVHVDRNFVLTFQVDLEKKFVLFVDFDHHDRIYSR